MGQEQLAIDAAAHAAREAGTAIVRREPAQPVALPLDVKVDSARLMADQLMAIGKQTPRLVMKRGDRMHLCVELWTTMGAMLQVVPVHRFARRLDRKDEIAYEAGVDLIHLPTQAVVGAGEALASSKEGAGWARHEYSIKSMAMTRAVGKAFRMGFSWIPVLAGFDPTPAEELHDDTVPPSPPPRPHRETPRPASAPPPSGSAGAGGAGGEKMISTPQSKRAWAIAHKRAESVGAEAVQIVMAAQTAVGVEHVKGASLSDEIPRHAYEAFVAAIESYQPGRTAAPPADDGEPPPEPPRDWDDDEQVPF